ncbi:protein S100-Z-like [Pristis pectinata]|uniref:protein S100-Z-like n=1 Tax=Pristis pectinata TaxID=685728 RepID=UPI00223E158D|nr:protein S100-Z-like [Pristis pectinata]
MDRTIEVFYKYSGEEADKTKLPKDKLSKLLEKKLKNFLKYRKDSEAVAHTMRDLDVNCDEQVDFKELMRLVTAITITYNDFFDDYRKNQGKQEK